MASTGKDQEAPPDAREIKTLKDLTKGIVLAQDNRFIKELLREKGVPIGANKEDFHRHLTEAIESGTLRLRDVTEWLAAVEGWGNQHVYLYRLSPALRTLLTEARIRRVVREAGLHGLWDAPTVLAFPPKPTLTSISFQKGILRLIWQESTPGWTPVPERDYEIEEGLDTFKFEASRRIEQRAITRFEAHLGKGLAAIFIAHPIQGEEHQEALGEVWRMIDILLEVTELESSQLDISDVSRNLDQQSLPSNAGHSPVVKTHKSRLTSGGAYVEFGANSLDKAFWEEQAILNVRSAVKTRQLGAFRGTDGVFLFQPGVGPKDLTRSLRVQLYGKDNRIRLWAQMKVDEVWHILTILKTYT